MRKHVLVFLFLLASACANQRRQSSPPPSGGFSPDIYYKQGLTLEGQKKYEEAAEKYKKAMAFYEGTPSADSAQSLYRLSICYEALNDDPKTILTLLELHQNQNFLSKQVANAEVPARLAGAYARQGNLDQAKIYYAQAEEGLKHLRGNHLGADTAIWLPKTLYSMGRLAPLNQTVNPTAYHNYISSLIQAQAWLVRCGELNVVPWAQKSADELLEDYQSAWIAIDQHPGPSESDKLQAMKIRQDEQRTMAADLDSAMEQLKLDRLPSTVDEPEPASLAEVFKQVSSIEDRVNILLQQQDIQDQPTPEAKKREGLRKDGEIKN